jgi:hypothetical protein
MAVLPKGDADYDFHKHFDHDHDLGDLHMHHPQCGSGCI